MPRKYMTPATQEFIGAYVSAEQKQRLTALAEVRGTTLSGVVREIADYARIGVVLPQKESSVGSVLPDAHAASR